MQAFKSERMEGKGRARENIKKGTQTIRGFFISHFRKHVRCWRKLCSMRRYFSLLGVFFNFFLLLFFLCVCESVCACTYICCRFKARNVEKQFPKERNQVSIAGCTPEKASGTEEKKSTEKDDWAILWPWWGGEGGRMFVKIVENVNLMLIRKCADEYMYVYVLFVDVYSQSIVHTCTPLTPFQPHRKSPSFPVSSCLYNHTYSIGLHKLTFFFYILWI